MSHFAFYMEILYELPKLRRTERSPFKVTVLSDLHNAKTKPVSTRSKPYCGMMVQSWGNSLTRVRNAVMFPLSSKLFIFRSIDYPFKFH